MATYEAHTFDIPDLEGISGKQIDEHLKLYHGYVKKTNYIIDMLESEDDSYKRAEIRRRFPFEFNGMRLHEYYFGQLEGGPQSLGDKSTLKQALANQYGSLEEWQERFVETAKTRGTGWAILYYDPREQQFFNQWIDFHHQGHLGPVDVIFALDVWEHAFMVDYTPGEKGTYIQKYFDNLNWEVVEEAYAGVQS